MPLNNPSAEATKAVTITLTNKSTATVASWVDVDCSAIIPTKAIAAFGYLYNTDAANPQNGGVRKNGSAIEGSYGIIPLNEHSFFIVELDENRVFEQKIGSALVDLYVTGYLI